MPALPKVHNQAMRDERVRPGPPLLEKTARYYCQEDLLEKGLATYSSILAWRNPWTEEPGGLQFIGLQRIGHDWSYLACTHCRGQLGKAEVLKCNPWTSSCSITLWSLEEMQILWSCLRSTTLQTLTVMILTRDKVKIANLSLPLPI